MVISRKRIEKTQKHKKCVFVFLCFCVQFLLSIHEIKAQIISNNTAYISILGGTVVGVDSININATATISNDGIINISIINNAGTIQGNGTYNILGDFFNTGTFFSGTSNVSFDSLSKLKIGGTGYMEFHNLTINNSSVTYPLTLEKNVTVKNNLTMTSGNINLAGFTLTLGTSAVLPGTLSYTSGWLYGGVFTRWFNVVTPTAIPSSVGHFPMGDSTLHYRPLWLGWSAGLTAGGTINVLHDVIYSSGPNTHVSFDDPSWAGGTLVKGISKSSWVVSTANGFNSSGSNISMRIGGTGFNPFFLEDVNLSIATSTVGDFSTSTSNNTPLEVNRNGLSTSNLTNTFYIGTRNLINTPLPIELLYFDANCADRKVIVKWATASEKNSYFFTLERTNDGILFEEVQRFQGAGNSFQTINYSFTDANLYQGINYYRLKQTDFDGMEESFDLVSVDCINNNGPNMTIYPSPAGENITIELNIEVQDDDSFVALFDVSGKIIKKIKCLKETNQLMYININELESGCYIVRLFNQNDFSQNARFIKQ